jgi:hypothetical protein
MADDYRSRRQYGDTLIEQIRLLIADAMKWNAEDLAIAPDHLDKREATDLVHVPTDTRVAVRCRRPEYIDSYFGQFTIRTSSFPSEHDKLTLFPAHLYYMFYCFQDEGGSLLHWWLMALRPDLAFIEPLGDFGNGTDSSFKAYQINPSVVVDSSEPFPYTAPPDPHAMEKHYI